MVTYLTKCYWHSIEFWLISKNARLKIRQKIAEKILCDFYKKNN